MKQGYFHALRSPGVRPLPVFVLRCVVYEQNLIADCAQVYTDGDSLHRELSIISKITPADGYAVFFIFN